MIPEIDTERLTLRGHRLEDFAEVAANWKEPEVTRFIGGKPFSDEETWTKLLRHVGHWSLLGFVREKATGRFVGEVGFADLHRELDPPFGSTPEIGWVLAPWCFGKGFATEAVNAALAWLGPRRSVCMIDLGNEKSIRVAEKAGYREYARTTYKGTPVILFERVSSR